jgi:tetratricopeptide (TPR) repeat protein
MNLKSKSLFVVAGLLAITAGSVRAQSPEVQTALKAIDSDLITQPRETLEKVASASPSAENQFYLGYYYLRAAAMEDEVAEPEKVKANLEKAKAAFDKGVAADAKYELNYVGQGGVMLGMGKEGKPLIDQALAASKNKDATVLYRAAEMYTLFDGKGQKNDPAEAIRLIDVIPTLKKAKMLPEYHLVKGDAYLIRNEGGPAVSEYEKALLLSTDNTTNAKIQTRIGKVYKRGKNYTETQKGFLAAIAADSTYAPVYREFGELWLLAGKYDNAATNYKKFLKFSEGTPENVLRYMKFAFLSKDYQSVLENLPKVEGKLKDPDIARMKAWSNIEKENYQLGVETLEQMLKSNPPKIYPADYGYLGRGYLKLENDSLAEMNLMKAAPADTNTNYYTDLYELKFKQKDYAAAGDMMSQAIDWKEARGERPSANDRFTLGRMYFFGFQIPKDTAVGRDTTYLVKADSAFSRLMNRVPEFPGGYIYKARVQRYFDVDGSKGLAVPFYEQFLTKVDTTKALTPQTRRDMGEAYEYLGRQAALKGDQDVATQMMQKAVQADSTNKNAQEFLNPPAPAAATTPKKGSTPKTAPKKPATGTRPKTTSSEKE